MPPRWSFSCRILHQSSCWFTVQCNQHSLLAAYHTIGDLQSPLSTTETHLIQPSDSSEDYATRNKLLPFRKWVNPTHHDTFIHGPFDFATVNGRKTWDRISQPDWDVLKTHCNMFHNPLPRFDVPSYSIHVDRGAHVTFHSDAIACQLIISAPNGNDTLDALKSPWQKVTASRAHHPPFFYINTPLWRCLIWGMTCWNRHIGSPLHQRVREVWEFGTIWEIFGIFDHNFSPCLASDLAHLVNYFWVA
jgi:hypothetical protein